MHTPPPPRPLHPEAQALLALVARAGHPPLHALSPERAREAYAASWPATQRPGAEVASVHEQQVPGAGAALRVRIYRPWGAGAREALPGLLYLHGGGWVVGNLDSHDPLCRRLANGARAMVVAVDYRLAPEHPYPAAVDDAAQALRWMAREAAALGIDPDALGVAGDSAGGNLAAVLALKARDGALPQLVHQCLLYPVTDLAAEAASYARADDTLPLSAAAMRYFIGHYTPRPEDRLHWRASPLRAPHLEGVAPALLLTVGHDPLCDEGRAYAERLDAAGVRVCAMHLNDQVHGLFGLDRLLPGARPLLDQVAALIGHELHRASRARRRADAPSPEDTGPGRVSMTPPGHRQEPDHRPTTRARSPFSPPGCLQQP